ncbi:MAG TPA: cyclodeaminase/cyclohydrolase family protein [Bryobacteraceae bacterium]
MPQAAKEFLLQDSLWKSTLAEFREKACGTDPLPAGVAISAVSASLALALLAKVLDIAVRRKNFSGDRQRLTALLDAAREESARLAQLADDDVHAFQEYMECKRQGRDPNEAVRNAIQVPMNAARSAVRGLELCSEAIGMLQGLTAADVGSAASLLSGAVRAFLLSANANDRTMRSDETFSRQVAAECRKLELGAQRWAETVTSKLRA